MEETWVFFLFLLNWGSQFTAFFFFFFLPVMVPSTALMIKTCCWGQGCGKDTSSMCFLLWLPQQSGSLPFLCTPLTEVQVCVCFKRSLMAGIVFNHSPYLPQCPACSRCSIHIPKDELRWDASGSQIWKSV